MDKICGACSGSSQTLFCDFRIPRLVLTITGWRDSDGSGEDGAFKGCQFGRVIIFEGNKVLKCMGYGYQYAYRPEAVILVKDGVFKMLVDGDAYDMQN